MATRPVTEVFLVVMVCQRMAAFADRNGSEFFSQSNHLVLKLALLFSVLVKAYRIFNVSGIGMFMDCNISDDGFG